jgi:YHYH protein
MNLARSVAPLLAVAAVAVLAACSATSSGNSPGVHAAAVDQHRLPLGDRRYLTHAQRGYVFSCITHFTGQGAQQNGPWIDSAAKTWDLTAKIAVQGSVDWPNARFSRKLSRSKDKLAGNGLPDHTTGVFPIAASDPAYQYDRNPNSIRSYTLAASLPRNPKVNRSPTCVGGTIGVMRNGIPLFSAFDAEGRDAPAHEVQDRCDGHPQITGQYHYHSLSACISDAGSKTSHSQLLGWALDGFGIYGLRGRHGVQMTTATLDACHGHTHTITWNGKRVRMYHYHATLDFPYMVSCYRGTPIRSATGLGIGGPP